MKTLIKNAVIADGTGNPSYHGYVVIENETIAACGLGGTDGSFDSIIDAEKKILCPGFIDTHSHSDLAILHNPRVEPKIRQGITTELLGQDGIAAAPIPPEHISPWKKNLAGLDGLYDELDFTWRDTKGYLDAIERQRPATNFAVLVPHGNVRMEAMGLSGTAANQTQLAAMQRILDRELASGGAGLSSGLIYIPCAYAQTAELEALCQVAAQHGKPFVVHQRSEADDIIESMKEILQLGYRTGVKIHFSHFKICGMKNREKRHEMLALLDRAKQDGIFVSFDQYPYAAGSTMLGVALPPWAHAGGTDALLERLRDNDTRRKMAQDIEHGIDGWDNFFAFAGADNIFVTSVLTKNNQELIGKSLTEIAELKGKDVFDATFDLLLEEQNAVGIYDNYGLEEDLALFMRREEQNFCTDGLLSGMPHPRVYGTYPRVLEKFVKEDKVLTLEEAVFKMTKKPAEVFGFTNRGEIVAGKAADLVIFDQDSIRNNATFTAPKAYPDGIELVMVNGSTVYQDGKETVARSGTVIRKE